MYASPFQMSARCKLWRFIRSLPLIPSCRELQVKKSVVKWLYGWRRGHRGHFVVTLIRSLIWSRRRCRPRHFGVFHLPTVARCSHGWMNAEWQWQRRRHASPRHCNKMIYRLHHIVSQCGPHDLRWAPGNRCDVCSKRLHDLKCTTPIVYGGT